VRTSPLDRRPSTNVRTLPERAEPPATVASGRIACRSCAATAVVLLLELGDVPVLIDDRPDDSDAGPVAPLCLARCTECDVLQVVDVLDDTQRQLVATATAPRSFAGRPESARRFCEDAIDRWKLEGDGHIIEVGSGTGALLRFFRAWQLPVLGIEPDERLTRYARLRRIPTWRARFDAAIADRIAHAGMHADLLIISTPIGAFDDLRKTLSAAAAVLAPGGVLTLEVPDVLRIVGRTRFDSVSHTDPIIPSVGQVQRLIAPFGLDVVDVERADMADDRLRLWIRSRQEGASVVGHPRLRTRLRAEASNGVEHVETIVAFASRARLIRRHIRSLLDDAAQRHCTVAAYGTSPDAITLACAVGLTRRDVAYVVDPYILSRCGNLPGTDVPVTGELGGATRRPDLVLAIDDLPSAPRGWEGVPIYAVADLADVVHRLTTEYALHYAR